MEEAPRTVLNADEMAKESREQSALKEKLETLNADIKHITTTLTSKTNVLEEDMGKKILSILGGFVGWRSENRRNVQKTQESLDTAEEDKQAFLLNLCVEDGALDSLLVRALPVLEELNETLLSMDVVEQVEHQELTGERDALERLIRDEIFASSKEKSEATVSLGKLAMFITLRKTIESYLDPQSPESVTNPASFLRGEVAVSLSEIKTILGIAMANKEESILNTSF